MEEVSTGVRLQFAHRPARLLRLVGDERLVAFVRAGDERAFEAVYDRHHRPILGFCRHMLGSREEAEDAVQQTFLSAYRDLLQSTKPVQLRPWLFAIARNRCLSMLRARREHAPLAVAEPSTEGLAATVERREDVRELLADLARLPEEQRAALLLAELGALDHAGIATVLGCRREQVKALVFQARSSLAADRQARATPCEDVRELLATASGGALRRAGLRRHLDACAGCRTFKAEVAHQRKLLAVALPVVPTALLKAGALPAGATGGTGAAGGLAAGGAGAGGAGAGLTTGGATGGLAAAGGSAGAAAGGLMATGAAGLAKVALAVTLAGTVAGGGALTVGAVREAGDKDAHRGGSAVQTSPTAGDAGRASARDAGTAQRPATAGASPRRDRTVPSQASRAHGFAPTLSPGRGGNGAAAREFAHTRGSRRSDASAGSLGTPRNLQKQTRDRPPKPATPRRSGANGSHGATGTPQGAAKAPVSSRPARDSAPAEETSADDAPGIEHRQAKAPAAPEAQTGD